MKMKISLEGFSGCLGEDWSLPSLVALESTRYRLGIVIITVAYFVSFSIFSVNTESSPAFPSGMSINGLKSDRGLYSLQHHLICVPFFMLVTALSHQLCSPCAPEAPLLATEASCLHMPWCENCPGWSLFLIILANGKSQQSTELRAGSRQQEGQTVNSFRPRPLKSHSRLTWPFPTQDEAAMLFRS